MRGTILLVCGAMLTGAIPAGCAHPVPALHGRTVVISGRNTAQDLPDVASRKVLSEAAAITLDHGYRYFQILGPIRPGAKVPIRLYEAGETIPVGQNTYDATLVMVNQPKPHKPSPEVEMIEH